MSRVDREPAFVLHRRAWRDTSLILELFTAVHGRIAAIARAARNPRSAFFGLAEPFRLLEAGWVRRGEMATLTVLEPAGPGSSSGGRLSGRALWCGLYANELLLKLTPRDDPEPEIFDAYRALLPDLADENRQAAALRRFELALLRALGVAPELGRCAATGEPVRAGRRYRVDPVVGPLPVGEHQSGIDGALLLALAHGEVPHPDQGPEQAAAALALMRKLIEYQLDGRKLSTPALFREKPQ